MRHANRSRRLYRALLGVYPREFRERFARDMESDFADLLSSRGRLGAWSKALRDLLRALPLTYADARAERRRLARLRGFEPSRGDTYMASLFFDFRHALRGLRKSPIFTIVTVITLALGIGANSAIFSLINAVLLRPLAYHAPDRLMLIHEVLPQSNVPRFGVSPPDFLDLAQYQRSFADLGIFRLRAFELAGTGEPEQVPGLQMSAAVFAALGVKATIGRTLAAADEQQNAAVAVLSHGLWQRQFGGRPEVIGERITLDRQPYTIVGVMPASFEWPKRGPYPNGERADVWVPLVFNPFERQARGMFYNHSVIARLRDNVTAEQAAEEMAALTPRIRENYPTALKNTQFSLIVQATPFVDEVSGQVRRPLLILLGAVVLVLLVACANVANLVLSRTVARQREIAVRVALGAARHRLFQMLLVESLTLACAGGVLGLLLGSWVVRAMPAVIATSLPGVSDVTLDARVVAFTFALSLLTAVVFGATPLVAGSRRELHDLSRDGGTRTTGGRRQHRVRRSLVVASVAFAFVLLVGAGLLIRSFNALTSVDHGVRPENVLTMRVSLPAAGYREPARSRAFYRNLQESLLAIRGVRTASVSTDVPIRSDGERRAFTPERQGEAGGLPPSVAVTWTQGDYFGTFGIPIIRGRAFLPEEQTENRSVAIVSRALASRFWPGEDAVGKRLRWGSAGPVNPWMTIVGVVGDVVDGQLGVDPVLHVYVPYSELSDAVLAAPIMGLARRVIMALRTDAAPSALVAPARAALATLDPMLAVSDVTTLDAIVDEASAPQRFSASVLGAFAAGALLLAAIGLYGVLAFGVSQRTREIGVRLALGSPRGDVLRLIVGEGMMLAGLGLGIGGVAAVAAARLLTTLLFETNAYDPWTFAVVPVLLSLVALLAAVVPARRASRVDPMLALRSE